MGVAPRGRVQEVKAVVAQLKSAGRSEHRIHRQACRPWGYYDSISWGQEEIDAMHRVRDVHHGRERASL